MITFDKLENRYVFSGTLILSEAMHIGSGMSDERVDSTFVKTANQFYIPGSSLRGALRSTIERIVYTLAPDQTKAKQTTCLLSKEIGSNCISVNKNTKDKFSDLVEKEIKESKIIDFFEKNGHLCEMCKLFGSTHFASKIKITDLHLVKGIPNNDPKGITRFGVGIDRDTETASEGALFEIEVVEKGHKFTFELIAENIDNKNNELGLLGIGLLEMLRGENGSFYIGAKSAAGLGKCFLNGEDFSIRYFDGKEELRTYLENDYPNRLPGEKAIDFIKKQVEKYIRKEGRNAKKNN